MSQGNDELLQARADLDVALRHVAKLQAKLDRQRLLLAHAELRVKNANERARQSLTGRFIRNSNERIRRLARENRTLQIELAAICQENIMLKEGVNAVERAAL